MSKFCNCGGVSLNTGKGKNTGLIKVAKKLIFVPLVANDGTANAIESNAVLNKAYFDALLENADKTKRWYPTGEYKNVEDTRADPTTETFTDQEAIITQEGIRTFSGMLLNYNPGYKKRLETLACNKLGVYVVDVCGAIYGSVSSDGKKLYPIQISENSLEVRLVKGADTVTTKLMVNFNFSPLERDENLRVIETSSLATDVDLLNSIGLLDAQVLNLVGTASDLAFDLVVGFSGFVDREKVIGRTIAGFTVTNVTDNANVPSTVVEAPEGTYTITFDAAQDVGDVVRLTGIENGIEVVQTEVTLS